MPPKTDAAPSDATIDPAIDRFLHTLRCNVCPNQSLAESQVPFALDVRRLVIEKLHAGTPPEAVRAFLIERYGAYVSYDPPLSLQTSALWLLPLLLLIPVARRVYALLRPRR